MQLMPRRKPTPPADPPKTPRVRTGYNLNVWIDSELGESFEEALKRIEPRTSKTALLEMLLREHLRSKGFWPPAPK